LFLDEKVIFKRQAVFIVGGFMNSLSHIRFEWNAAITISIMKGMFHHSVFTAIVLLLWYVNKPQASCEGTTEK